MDAFETRAEGKEPGISRRQALCRTAVGLAGAILANLGLATGKSYGQAPRYYSLRAVFRQIANCDPSHGIRMMFPENRGVISLRDVIRRFYRP